MRSPDTFLSFIFITPSYPSVAKDGVSIFSFNSGTTPAASLIMDVFQHSSPGGTLVAIFDPTTGIIRPVHRAYLCHAHSGEIPLFESHFQRWNTSFSEHHSEALTVIEKTVEPPATWKRSPFGPLQGDIKRSFHVFQPLSTVILQAEHTCREACPLITKISRDTIIYIYPASSRVEKFQPTETSKKSE